jgi:hypothetical protein
MIIDGHNHLGGPDKGDGASQTPEDIVNVMDSAGVDKAVIFPFNEVNPGVSFSNANDFIASAVEKFPDRLIGFCRLDPNYEDKALRELDRSITELELSGVKLHPTAQEFLPEHPYVIKIIERAAELDVPVIFDNGKVMSPNEGIGKLAESVPDAKIILAHMRGGNFIEVAEEHENVYLGTVKAWALKKIEEAIQRLGAEKIIAGSDSPYSSMRKEIIEKFEQIKISEKEKKLIRGGNMARLLNL